jgi:carbamoyl-phosphate synthase large subunit
LLGTPLAAIEMAEDRQRFRELLERIGQPFPASEIVEGASPAERQAAAARALEVIGLPVIVRPAFTLGGSGGGIVASQAEYRERVRAGLRASPIGQVIVERYLDGWQEVEYEVMRDADDTCICVCSMENVDPLGVHTGDSIVVAPVQTLPDQVNQMLRSAALAIIRALGVEGGCNVQFALSPDHAEYAVIEVNPARIPFVRPRLKGDRLSHRARGRPDRDRSAAGRDPERHHRHDRGGLRARPRLRRGQAAALPVRTSSPARTVCWVPR